MSYIFWSNAVSEIYTYLEKHPFTLKENTLFYVYVLGSELGPGVGGGAVVRKEKWERKLGI